MNKTYAQVVFENFRKHRLGFASLFVILIFCFIGIYAPLLASSKPLVVNYDGIWYFPLFRYLFFTGFYTKPLDIFFNLFMFTVPLLILIYFIVMPKKIRSVLMGSVLILQLILFTWIITSRSMDPAQDPKLNYMRMEASKNQKGIHSFEFDLKYMTPYKKLNLLLNYLQLKDQNERLSDISEEYKLKAIHSLVEMAARDERALLLSQGVLLQDLPNIEELKKQGWRKISADELKAKTQIPTLWNINLENQHQQIIRLKEELTQNPKNLITQASLKYIEDKDKWLTGESAKIRFRVMPLVRDFHFEEDAGGEQSLNQYLPWWELSRTNRKDLVAALIFGVRVSLVVGILAVGLSLIISVPIGAFAGYYGGTFDIIVSRLLEVLEAMPTFFMLLMIIAITQSKSIFLVIAMIGLFGWTGFSRYIRGEFFKQRNLPYVESCHALGFSDAHIMFSQILPNAIPPLLTLLPFAMMGAITSEAGLSFLGLGEEGSASWGVLMDEGRSAFPAESYLLWPPAILLTILLVAIALVGDGLRDAIDPKMR
ncbi:MAG: ABC transporter permease subunit [Parachlamydiaceae bacterium]|nr:ABC transporter permease subunit [Parachlamydiaceae bacterium]